jgi:hypothetical protein
VWGGSQSLSYDIGADVVLMWLSGYIPQHFLKTQPLLEPSFLCINKHRHEQRHTHVLIHGISTHTHQRKDNQKVKDVYISLHDAHRKRGQMVA